MTRDQNQPRQICVGKIAAPHGVKGLVKILVFAEDASLIEAVSDFNISLKNPSGKYILATIEGVNSREDVEALKGTELFVPRDALPEPEEGEFYYEDLKGLKAIDEDGEQIGTIKEVVNFGAGDLLEVRTKNGDLLIPFTDEFVPTIGESVTLRNYEGFII